MKKIVWHLTYLCTILFSSDGINVFKLEYQLHHGQIDSSCKHKQHKLGIVLHVGFPSLLFFFSIFIDYTFLMT